MGHCAPVRSARVAKLIPSPRHTHCCQHALRPIRDTVTLRIYRTVHSFSLREGVVSRAGTNHGTPAFKGFGTPNIEFQQGADQHASDGNNWALRIFLYAVEEAATQQALVDAKLQDKVAITTDLKLADAVIAVKQTSSGKHVKLAQGEKAAKNAGIPFLCIGRQMNKANLSSALQPLLQSKRNNMNTS